MPPDASHSDKILEIFTNALRSLLHMDNTQIFSERREDGSCVLIFPRLHEQHIPDFEKFLYYCHEAGLDNPPPEGMAPVTQLHYETRGSNTHLFLSHYARTSPSEREQKEILRELAQTLLRGETLPPPPPPEISSYRREEETLSRVNKLMGMARS